MKVKVWNYGQYSSDNYGVHTMGFTDAYGNDYYFSYRTLVAFRTKGNLYVRENVWGTTTGKHLNWIDGGDKKNRLSKEDFENMMNNLLGVRSVELVA